MSRPRSQFLLFGLLALTLIASAHGKVSITTSSLPSAEVGVVYPNTTLTANGGQPPYSWSSSSGALPPGLGLSGNGKISGTPTTAGSYTFTVTVADNNTPPQTANATLSITIQPRPSITATSLPNGQVNAAYSSSVSASGGVQPYSFSVATGSLPQGLTLASSGAITGTPASAGTSNFTLMVTDANGATATQAFALTINPPPLSITTASLPAGTVNVRYSQGITASGGTPPYSYSLAAGFLPQGLSLVNGAISGIPTTAGTTNFTLKVTDAANASATQALAITINAPPLSITTSSLPNGTTGSAYSQNLSASGGVTPYAWTITGSLPAGLSLTSAGQISGTPVSAGTANFSAKVTDANGASATQALSITIIAGVSIGSCPAARGTVSQPYHSPLTATGGTPPYTWSLDSGQLPPGLGLDASSGVIAGTPSAAGSYDFTLKAADTTGASNRLTCNISVAPALTVTTNSLPPATVGGNYSQTLTATGGQTPYTWSISSGSPPQGLTLSGGGVLSGTPTSSGAFNFTARATDSAGATADSPLTLSVSAALSIGSCPAATATTGQPYSSAAGAAGGQPAYSWTVSAGQLPAGLSLDSASGTVSGSPGQAGQATFTLRVADTAGNSATRACTLSVSSALTVTSSAVAPAPVNTAYTQTLSASGGSSPYTWSISSGSLPPGISLNAAGTLAGAATAQGTYSFTARVTDSLGMTAEKALVLAVTAPLTISFCPVGSATFGSSYSYTVTASGGKAPYAWSIGSGLLPSGLTLNASNGTIAGTPTANGNFDFQLKVTDAASASAVLACTIRVSTAFNITSDQLPDGTLRVPYSQAVTASGGTLPYFWSNSAGSLPPGITLNPATGVLSGTPTSPGSYRFTIRVDDSSGLFAEREFTITIGAGLTIPSCPTSITDSGVAYSSVITAIGGAGGYSFTLSTGALPAGLSLNSATGTISGSAAQTGDTGFTLKVTDRAGAAATRACTIKVRAALSIANSSLPDGALGVPYSQALTASGGTAPYAWSLSAGSLPPGLFLNSGTGQITGTPTAGGGFKFTIALNDSAGGQTTKEFTVNISAGVFIPDCTLPGATAGQNYSASLVARGGQPPYQFSISAGALPDGLNLSSDSGMVAGVPGSTGAFSFTARVTDTSGGSATRACVINVAGPGITITTAAALGPVVAGSQLSQSLTATGGASPYTWSLSNGTLPGGISLDPAGQLTGIPASAGTYQFTLQVQDQAQSTASQSFTLNVLLAPAPSVSFPGLTDFLAPAQQPVVDIALGSSYPADIQGTLTLTFTPDPGVAVDDPAIRFSNGSRTVTFTVPANSTKVVFPVPALALQTGTVAGAVDLAVTMQANGADLAPDGAHKTMRIDRLAPKVTSAVVAQVPGGFEVRITGYSTTREVTSGTFHFVPGAGSNQQAVDVPVSMTDASVRWFKDPASTRFGGQFSLTQPFTIQGGAATLDSVAITLTNGQGTSQAAVAKF